MKKVVCVLLLLFLLVSCEQNRERIKELEWENYELESKVSDLQGELEEANGRISELEEKLSNAQVTIEDARAEFLDGNFGWGLDGLDEAESELDY